MSLVKYGNKSGHRVVLLLLILSSYLTEALPILNALPKREIVTRVHTASTTNTVTDVYSTTTELVVAPTVEFIISGDVTMTTTLPLADGSVATVAPTATITVQVAAASVATSSVDTGSSTQCQTTITYGSAGGVLTKTVSAVQVSAVEATSSSLETASSSSSTEADATTVATTLAGAGQVSTDSADTTQTSASTTSTTSITPSTTSSPATTSSITSTTSSTSSSETSSTSTKSTGSITSAPTALVYSPYNNDGTCKSSSAVNSDLEFIQSKGVSKIRVYGTDCNSLETVLSSCVSLGLKVNQGLWIDSDGVDSIDDSVTDLVSYGEENGWDVFDFITIGNEAVLSGYCTVDELISKISSVRSTIESAGYTGKFTTSEAPVTFEDNPSLCTDADIDFVGINTHAYFDVNSSADTAGSFVVGQQELIQEVCGTSNVVITETGYPSQGIQNGGNIPSSANQVIAVQNILDKTGQQVTILSTFNDYWKQPGTYGIEQYFGIGDDLSTV